MKKYKQIVGLKDTQKDTIWTRHAFCNQYYSPCRDNMDGTIVENSPKVFELVVEKSWEIIEFRSKCGSMTFILSKNGLYQGKYSGYSLNDMLHDLSCVDSGAYFIHSVKRLSDGAIFSVGDKVYDNCKEAAASIKEFKIQGDKMIAVRNCVEADMFTYYLDNIKKVEPEKSVSGGKTCFQVFNNSNETIVIHGIGEYINKGQSEATISSLKLKISMLEREVKELETGHHCHTASEIQGLYTKIEKLTGELKDAKNVSSRIKYMTDSIFNNDLAKENKELKEEIRELNSLMRKADDHFVSCLASDKFSMKSLITFRKYFEKL